MLARNAEGLYWIGRYLERARHGCRLLAEQISALEDQPVEQIDRNWRRLYRAVGRTPIGGDLVSNADDDDFMLADAYTLTDDLTFERNNPDSIRNCVANARENARQVRNVIADSLWSCLNLAWLELSDVGIETIWTDRPEVFYERTENAIRTFSGVAESAIYRDDPWQFLMLGRFIERTQLLAALLDAHIALFPTDDPHHESDWRSLLQVCEAEFAYRHLYSLQHRPHFVVDFLVVDARLAHSIRYALARIVEALDAVSGGRPLDSAPGRRAGRMVAAIDYDWPERAHDDDAATQAALEDVRTSCRSLHDEISATYFDYEIEDTP